nr:S9 family peptidase [Chitinophagales bacterium]
MKNLLLSVLISVLSTFLVFAQSSSVQSQYPQTKKGSEADNYFGTQVADPYRWLEDDNSEETKEWVKSQNAVTFDYLSKIPYREQIRKRITELYNYPRSSAPYRQGDHYFFTKNDGLQPQSIYYYQKGLSGNPDVFIDPNKLNEAGTTAVNFVGFSNDRRHVAYSMADAGSDWQTIYIREIASNKLLNDELKWTKFSGAGWYKDGFFYSRYDEPKKGEAMSHVNEFQKVFYHKLSDQQSADQLVYQDSANAQRYLSAQTTEDEKFLIMNIYAGTDGSEIQYRDLRSNDNDFHLVFPGFKYNYTVLDNEEESFIVQTNNGAPNYKVVLVDPAHPEISNWKTLIPEKPELLQNVWLAGGKIFTEYLKDATSRVYQFNRRGELEHEVQLPGYGTVAGFTGEKNDTVVFYSFTSFTTPASIYKYGIATGKSEIFRKPEVKFN